MVNLYHKNTLIFIIIIIIMIIIINSSINILKQVPIYFSCF